MSRNVTHKINATAKEEDVVIDILEQGMTTQQQHPTYPSQQRRLEAGDDDTEAQFGLTRFIMNDIEEGDAPKNEATVLLPNRRPQTGVNSRRDELGQSRRAWLAVGVVLVLLLGGYYCVMHHKKTTQGQIKPVTKLPPVLPPPPSLDDVIPVSSDGSQVLGISNVRPPQGKYKDIYTKKTHSVLSDIFGMTITQNNNMTVESERTVKRSGSVDVVTTRKIGKFEVVRSRGSNPRSESFCDTNKGPPYDAGMPHLFCTGTPSETFHYAMDDEGTLVSSKGHVQSYHEEPSRMLKFLPHNGPVSVNETWTFSLDKFNIGLFSVHVDGISTFRGFVRRQDHEYALVQSAGSFQTDEDFLGVNMHFSGTLTASILWDQEHNISAWASMMFQHTITYTDKNGHSETEPAPGEEEYVFVTLWLDH